MNTIIISINTIIGIIWCILVIIVLIKLIKSITIKEEKPNENISRQRNN